MYSSAKKKRNIFAVLLTAVCVIAFSGCSGEEPEETTVPTKTVAVTDEEGTPVTDENGKEVFEDVPLESRAVTDELGITMTDDYGEPVIEFFDPEEEPPPIIYKVGFVYSDELENGTTRAMFEAARGQIKKVLGLETCYIEDVLVADFPEAVNVLRDEGCNIIVSCNPKYANSAEKESKSSTDTYYISFGGSSSGKHLSSFGGELYQTAAVCGLAAAHNTVSNVVGVIADRGEYNVFGVVDGFVIGASEIWKYADVRINWAWSNSTSEIEAAVDDLISQGCDVIMSYMETDYPIRYCEEKGVKVIGNCHNMPEIAPNNYITGFNFQFSTFLVDEIRSIINDNYDPKIYSGDIAAGMVRLVQVNPLSEEGTENICLKLYDYIKSGKDKVFTGEIKNTDGTIMIEKGQSIEFENILKVNWLVQGIRKTGDFTEINENPTSSTFEVKR